MMKIRTDQLQVPSEEQRKIRQDAEVKSGFGDLLARELGKSGETAAVASPPPLAAPPLLGVEASQAVETGEPAEHTVMESVESLLNDWEKYADELDTTDDEPHLKQAYNTLERIGDQVKKLKDENPGLVEASPELKSLVDEIEIMTVTETVKFNRGDYF